MVEVHCPSNAVSHSSNASALEGPFLSTSIKDPISPMPHFLLPAIATRTPNPSQQGNLVHLLNDQVISAPTASLEQQLAEMKHTNNEVEKQNVVLCHQVDQMSCGLTISNVSNFPTESFCLQNVFPKNVKEKVIDVLHEESWKISVISKKMRIKIIFGIRTLVKI